MPPIVTPAAQQHNSAIASGAAFGTSEQSGAGGQMIGFILPFHTGQGALQILDFSGCFSGFGIESLFSGLMTNNLSVVGSFPLTQGLDFSFDNNSSGANDNDSASGGANQAASPFELTLGAPSQGVNNFHDLNHFHLGQFNSPNVGQSQGGGQGMGAGGGGFTMAA